MRGRSFPVNCCVQPGKSTVDCGGRVVFGVLLTVSRAAFLQIGIELVLASSGAVVEHTDYPILATLSIAVPAFAVCGLAAGVPYLIWRLRRR